MKLKRHIPNLLTILRILLAPLAIWLSVENRALLIGGIIFLVCCITDFLDGYLSRKWNVTSRFGKTFDPLADKVLIIGCLIGFLINGHVIGWIAIALIVRDIAMDIIRLALYKKKTIPASSIAKLKTILQMIGLLCIFFIRHSGTCGWLVSYEDMDWIIQIPLMLAIVCSWWSFLMYLRRIKVK